MAAQDLLDALIADRGCAQPERDDPRLAPTSAPLDDRDTADLLAWLQALAAEVQYYDQSPTLPAGRWQGFLPAGDRAALAGLAARDDGGVAPHHALLVAFLELARRPQAMLNDFTRRHLMFQMRQVLGFVPRAAQPDHAHLVLELKKGAPAVELSTAHRFTAGKDTTKVEQLFAPVRRAVIGQARVKRLAALTRDGQTLRFAPVADSADGLGGALDKTEPRWPPFGRSTWPLAPVGFALASTLLRLAEGQRTLNVSLRLSGQSEASSAERIAASFEAMVTGPKGWSGPYPLVGSAAADTLTLSCVLPEGAPALVDHDPAVHAQPFPAGLPVLQLLLKDGGPLRFGALSGLSVRSAQLKVQVSGVRGLVLENDQATLDAKKAFTPFGAQPVAGSRFFVGCPEALAKPLSTLSLRLVWQGAPPDLQTWYAGYPGVRRMDDGVSATLSWQSSAGSVHTTAPQTLLARRPAPTTLSTTAVSSASASGPAFGPAFGGLHALRFESGGLALRRAVTRQLWLRPTAGAASTPRPGFLTVTLQEDLLHGEFRAASMTAATGTSPGVVNEPYTPKVQEITLDYTAQSDVSRLDDPAMAAFSQTDVQFFHVDALGVAREQAWLAAQRPWAPQGVVPLLPVHDAAGELLIGVEATGAGHELSLLLQVAEGSADPQAQAQTLAWSVLADNAWRTLSPGELVLDTTRSLRGSGLVGVVLPRETSTEHTRLPAGLVWLRASIPAQPRAACDLVGVHANGVEVVFSDQGNDPQRLAVALPAHSISKLKTPMAEVKAVLQPYASFGGALIEDDAALARRASERLRHRDRAITGWDYERLVLQAFPQVHRVKCIPHASESSWLAGGHTMLIVVPDLRNHNAVDPLQPRVDLDTLQRMREHLAARCGMQVRLAVRNPRYTPVRADFKLRLKPGFGFAFHGPALNLALQQALSPWAFDGAAPLGFGARVVRSALVDFVESLPYVDFVTDFHLGREGVAEDRAEIAPDAPDVILVSAAQHGITELLDD